MSRSVLEDAFAHHVWATLLLVGSCLALSPEQLGTAVPGTYGSILDTVRHLVGSDSWYLFDITGDGSRRIEQDRWTSRSSGPRWRTMARPGPRSWPRTSILRPS
jgi:uncharacterized damage-inducible protein DinB